MIFTSSTMLEAYTFSAGSEPGFLKYLSKTVSQKSSAHTDLAIQFFKYSYHFYLIALCDLHVSYVLDDWFLKKKIWLLVHKNYKLKILPERFLLVQKGVFQANACPSERIDRSWPSPLFTVL